MQIEVYKKFYDPLEANIIASRLQAHGIQCFLTNEHISTLLWHMSVAHGGVNLMLDIKDFARADELLSVDGTMKADEEPNGIHCPECHSSNVNLGSVSTRKINWWQIIYLLLLGLPAPSIRSAYLCFNCGNNFEKEDIN